MQPQEYHLTITPYNAANSPAELLAEASGLSRQQVKEAMQQGAVWLGSGGHTRRLRRHKTRLKPGDQLHLYYNPAVLEQQPPAAQLIADEGDYSVWCKPPGMLSQGSKWSDHTTITRWAELHLQPQRPALLVHRLDRAAGGLILIAHAKGMARKLAALFEARQIEKQYQVIVEGKFPGKPAQHRFEQPLDDKPALSIVQRLAFDPLAKRSLLQVDIETGRKHQIRRHLAMTGFPVVGDRLYGDADTQDDLQLTAVSLAFDHPVSGEARRYELAEELRPKLPPPAQD